ncbi:MAG: transglutaminase-like domain-containing protein [Isosphaeraceae bacterium]
MPRRHLATSWIAFLLLAGGTTSLNPSRAQDARGEPLAKPQQSWDAVYMSGTKVGYVHTQVERLKDPTKDRELLRVQVDTVLSFKRRNDKITQRVRYGTIETPGGSVLRLDIRVQSGQDEMRTYGDVVDDKMPLTLVGGGQKKQLEMPWGPEIRGPYAAELSLARQPMQAGEEREEKMFIPLLNKIGTLKLKAERKETIELGGRVKRELLRVEAPVFGPDGKPLVESSSTLWVDDNGQILKQSSDVYGGTAFYRTTEAAAKAPNGEMDLIAEQIVKIPQKIPTPERTRAVVYQVGVTGSDPASLFPADRRQKTRPGRQAGTTVLEVRTAGPNDGEAGPEAVGDEYTQPNPQINSADPRVVGHMKRAVGNATEPWARATAIQHWVARNIRAKNFTQGFANAAEVAESLTGDCTEHSVLTAAMCRAAGIPSRVAIGLVYADQLGGFGFHMWNEVYVNRRWVAIDSAFDQSDVDAVHLKLSDSSLDGVSPFESFEAVAKVFKKLTLKPLEIR